MTNENSKLRRKTPTRGFPGSTAHLAIVISSDPLLCQDSRLYPFSGYPENGFWNCEKHEKQWIKAKQTFTGQAH